MKIRSSHLLDNLSNCLMNLKNSGDSTRTGFEPLRSCGVWNQMKLWSSHLLDNLSNCIMKNSGDSTGFEPMTSAVLVQCSNQLSYEVTQFKAGQFVGVMFSRERNVVWKKCYMKCGVWNQMNKNLSNCLMKNSGYSTGFEPMTSTIRIPYALSHLNFSGSWDNCLNCPASARIISSFDFKHRTSYNTSFICKDNIENCVNRIHIGWNRNLIKYLHALKWMAKTSSRFGV